MTEYTEIELTEDLECESVSNGEWCGWAGQLTVTAFADNTVATFEWECPQCDTLRFTSTNVEGMFDTDTDRFLER